MDWFLDVRAISHGGPIGTLKFSDGSTFLQDNKQLLSEARARHVVLMAHGYNVNRPHGIQSLTYFKRHFQRVVGEDVLFIGILWPGDCILPIFVDYIWEGSEAETAGKMIGEFVQQCLAPIASSISFFSHSLGARVILNAIAQLKDPVEVRHAILMAGAIEDDTLLHEFNSAALRAKKITVIYSLEDEVLKLAYPAGNLVGGLLERGDANVIPALGRHGPSTGWGGKIIPNAGLPLSWNYGHTDYLTTQQTLDANGQEFYLPPAAATRIPSPSPQPIPDGEPQALQQNNLWKATWSPAFTGNRWLRPDES